MTAKLKGVAQLLMALANLLPAAADPLDHWHWGNPLPSGHTMRSVAYGNGTFVTVGYAGTIMTSVDGTNWSNQKSGTDDDLSTVAYANSKFIAISGGVNVYDDYVLTSSNGVDWATYPIRGVFGGYGGVAFGNGVFVIVTDHGSPSFLTSADGLHWTNGMQTFNYAANAVAFARSVFVTVESFGGFILSSTNGVDWIQRSSGKPDNNTVLSGITSGAAGFVAVGHDGVGRGTTLSSPDGITWTAHDPATPAKLFGVTFADGLYVAVGENGTILSSSDGTTWVFNDSGTTNDLYAITYGNGFFMAVGRDHEGVNGVYSTEVTSFDGIHWADHGSFITRTNQQSQGSYLFGLAYGDGTFVAVGEAGTVLTSTNGAVWNSVGSGTSGPLQAATFANDMFVIVSEDGAILTSSNKIDWTIRYRSTNSLYDVAYGAGSFVAVGSSGTILTSPDAVQWTAQEWTPLNSVSKSDVGLFGITFGGGTFVAVGYSPFDFFFGQIAAVCSTDATNWFYEAMDPFLPQGDQRIATDVAYGNGRFVMAINDLGDGFQSKARILVSTNGFQWTQSAFIPGLGLYGVRFGNGIFIAVGSGTCFSGNCESMVLSSTDGVNWTFRWTGSGNRGLNGVAYGGSTFVLAGEYGTLLQSDKFGPHLVPSYSTSSLFSFTLVGESGQAYRIEASPDLTNWTSLTNLVSATGVSQFTDLSTLTFARRFYRAVEQ